jgi:hypothetical protein
MAVLATWYFRGVKSSQKKGFVSDLCVGRFKLLAPYFEFVTLTDLKDKSEYDLCSTLPLNHQLLMSAFYKTVLARELAVSFHPGSVVVPQVDNGRLVFTSEQLCSSRYQRNDRLFVSDICKNFSAQDFNKVTLFIMSKCNLYDKDMADIADLLIDAVTNSCRFPNLVTLDISWNQFHGIDDGLKAIVDGGISRILQLDHLKFLDITYCPFATTDRKNDYFAKASKLSDEKLIWVPVNFLEGRDGNAPGWYNIITDPDRRAVILKVHHEYYASIKNLSM